MNSGSQYEIPVTADFSLTEEDLVAFAVVARVKSPWRRQRQRAKKISFGFWLALWAGVGLGVPVLGQGAQSLGIVRDAASFTVGAFAAILLCFVALVLAAVPLTRWNAARTIADGTFQQMLDRQSVIVRDHGICLTQLDGTEIFHPWSSIILILKTASTAYFFITSMHAIIVPKRALPTGFDRFVERAERLWRGGREASLVAASGGQ